MKWNIRKLHGAMTFETKLNTGFASGTAADVIHYSMSSIGARVPMGQYECLDDYVKDWEDLG